MLTSEQIIAHLQEFVGRELLGGQADGLNAQTPLLEHGLVDSMTVVMLVDDIRKTYNVVIPAKELVPNNLANIDAIAQMVVRLHNVR